MSTSNINHQIAQAIHFKIEALAQEMKGFNWSISETNLGSCILENKLHQATAVVLSQLCAEIDLDEQILPRLTDKIIHANKIIEGLCISSLEDPRLKELPLKIERLNQNCLHKSKKIEKYSNYLNRIAQSDQVPFSKILPLQIQLKRTTLELEKPYEHPPLSCSSDEISPIFFFQSAINGLELLSKEGFAKALDRIIWLENLTFTTFTGDKEQIANRIFFHLQNIHKKEYPQKAGLKDAHYGSNAFLSEETPNEEKLRAVKRTQVEICLFALEKCLEGDKSIQSPIANEPTLKGIFKILEELHMDQKDMPVGQKNIAHALFANMYTNYLTAWETHKNMIHPHDRTFKNDFGRYAFLGDSQSLVSNEYKLQAMSVITVDLWDAWGL